uniref:Endonuclease/exonuclease/phosphatase domain-containing protein n=1 Tax=Cyprinus carpio carpio TaxID=630221 RepID=A0A9J8ALG5_CYPCA
MWIYHLFSRVTIVWIVLSSLLHPTTSLFLYTATELYRLRCYSAEPPPSLYPDQDIVHRPRPKYIHRGSRRGFRYDDSKDIRSFWTSTPRAARKTRRTIDQSALTSVSRSTSSSFGGNELKVGLLNIRSLSNKGLLISDIIDNSKFDFFCLVETWQQENDFLELNHACPPGFVYISQPRISRRGGGLAILHNSIYKTSPLSVQNYVSFESAALLISGPTPTVLAVIYRPPKYCNTFISEFCAFLTHLCTLSPNLILLGDFNIHMDTASNLLTRDFNSCLDSFGLQQYVNFPTHSKGHTLDLICCSGVTPWDCTADVIPISDHKLLSFNVDVTLSKSKQQRLMSFRNIKKISPSVLTDAIADFPPSDQLTSPDNLVSFYNFELQQLLDTLAPLKTRTVSFTHSAPWFTPELCQLKTRGRRLERLYKRTGLMIHRELYSEHVHLYKDALYAAKNVFYSRLIESGDGNTKALKPPDTLPGSWCS